MNEVKQFFQTAYADAKALLARAEADVATLTQHVANLEKSLGVDVNTLELSDPQPNGEGA